VHSSSLEAKVDFGSFWMLYRLDDVGEGNDNSFQLHQITIATTEMVKSTVSMMVFIIVYDHECVD